MVTIYKLCCSLMFAKKEESNQILLVLSVKGMAELSATIAMAEVPLSLSLTRTHHTHTHTHTHTKDRDTDNLRTYACTGHTSDAISDLTVKAGVKISRDT
ncbi:hypothetical protein HAX54_038825 [Datura stramonium]|uniref:Uncharacterized protein n=1 Tax=Datura stramonium TaxID=4076 RepID=A0ABS8SIE9_DATST|nr:hypothetical protein [Datura stramonium]